MHGRQLVAGAEQGFHVGLREVYVVGGNFHRNGRGIFRLRFLQQAVALDGAQCFPGDQALVVVGDDHDLDRRVVG